MATNTLSMLGLGEEQAQQPSHLRSLLGGDGFGNTLQALGASLMSSPRNAPLSNFGTNLANFQTTTMRQRAMEQEQVKSEEEKQRRALVSQSLKEVLPANLHSLADADPDTAMKLYQQMQTGGNDTTFFGTPIWGVGPDGQPAFGQLNNQGQFQVTETPEGFQFGKEPIRLDAGTHYVLLDPVTRQQVGIIPKNGDVPTGYGVDTNTGTMAPLPGSPAEQEQTALQSKAWSSFNAYDQQQGIVSQDIGRALEIANSVPSTGIFSLLNAVPGSPQHDLAGLLETIEANVGFAELQEMRANSPTGGALGSVTERELALLSSTMGNLRQSQSRDQFVTNLNRLNQQIAQSRAAIRAAYERDFGGAGGGGGGTPAPSAGNVFVYNPATGKLEPQ